MTCCRSQSFSVSLDGMVSARSIRHLTTARLLWAGLWDAKSRYLLVWVALRCTLTVIFPDLSTVLRVSRNAMVWWFWDDTDGSSTVNVDVFREFYNSTLNPWFKPYLMSKTGGYKTVAPKRCFSLLALIFHSCACSLSKIRSNLNVCGLHFCHQTWRLMFYCKTPWRSLR